MKLEPFLTGYVAKYLDGMSGLGVEELNAAINVVKKCIREDLAIYVGGNGGSAAISNHLCCDFIKGASAHTVSMSCNTPLITMVANDMGYEHSLSYQLANAKHIGSVILVSSSGNSPNIIEAANWCRNHNITLIGLTGFDGGKLKAMCDISLHIPIKNYGVVEDCHQSIMHIISQYIHKGSEHVSK